MIPDAGRETDGAPIGDRTATGNRGVSTVLGYSMTLVIATLLVSGLFFTTGSLVESQQEQAAAAEMDVVGERVAATVETVDRMARASNDGSIAVQTVLPDRLAGSSYEMRISSEDGNAQLTVALDGSDRRTTVPLDTETPIEPREIDGGTVVVTWEESGAMEVTRV